MARAEEFADPVVVPGPNVRSRFVETEGTAADTTTEIEPTDLLRCPACGRGFAVATLVCPDDGTFVTDRPADVDP